MVLYVRSVHSTREKTTENETSQWKFSPSESFETCFLNFLLELDGYPPVHPDSSLLRYLVRKDFMSEICFLLLKISRRLDYLF